ncbi:MAG: hypothetical protein ACK5P0_00805 [bacterium]|jgi:hypothetical protein
MANTVAIDVKINALEASKSLKELRTGLKDAVNELAGLETGTQDFKRLAGAIDDAKDRIEKLNADIEQVGGAGKFGAIADFGSKIAAGFEVAQGAMALFGSESEQVKQALEKVQAAMALTQGLKDLSEFGKSWTQLKTVVGDFGKSAMAALQGMKAGIAATGIGVLLVAVGALVAYWDDIKGFFDSLSEGAEKTKALNETLGDFKKGAQDAFKEINDVKVAFQQAKDGVLSKEEALKKYNDTLGPTLGLAKDLNEAEAIMIKKADAYIKAQGLKAQANALFNKAAEEQAKSLTASVEDQTNIIDKSLGLFFKVQGQAALSENILKEQQDRGVKNAQKNADQKKKIFEEEGQNLLKQADALMKNFDITEKKTITNSQNNYKKKAEVKIKIEKKLLQDMEMIQVEEVSSNQKRNDDILKSNFDFEKAQLEMLKAQSDKKKRLNESNYNEEYEIAKMQLDKILNDENKNNFDRLIAQEQFNAKVSELDEIERERKQKAADATLNITKGALQATADLVSAFAGKSVEAQKKAFEFQKGVNIANAIIDTYQSAVAAYKGSIGVPIVGPVLAPIAAATAVAAGIANIRKIEQTNFNSKDSPSSGGGGGGGSFAPNLSAPVGNTSTNLASIGFGQEQTAEPVKVFVTETDISSSQKNVQKIEQKASIE